MKRGNKRLPILGMAILILTIMGCSRPVAPQSEARETPAQATTVEETAPPQQTPQVVNTATPEVPDDPFAGWQAYTNENFQLSLMIPPMWYGPDVYEVDDEVRLAIGSDTVYPYGTDRADQHYSAQDSYYITIQYRRNPGYSTLQEYSEAQPWMSTYMALLDLEDGESISGMRDLNIKVRDVEVGQFRGLEYIATLSETAQTEYFYARQVMLFDEDLNALMIMGFPNNVKIAEGGDWREAYRNVDQAYQPVFEAVVESIVVE